MKKHFTILCLLVSAQKAEASDVLSFSAQVEDETLAEEAILLVHCLADRSGHPWEFNGETRGAQWLKLHEEAHQLKGYYHKAGKDYAVSMKSGGSDDTCELLEPAKSNSAAFASLIPTKPLDPTPIPEDISADADFSPRKAWPWVAAGVIVVSGFFLWRAHQPTYRSIEMN